MRPEYLEADARAASNKNGEFLRKLYGDQNASLVVRGFLAGYADVLTALKGTRYAFESLHMLADDLQSEQNKRERAA